MTKAQEANLKTRPPGLRSTLDSKKLIFWPLLGIVLLAPLPFASVLQWAWAPIGLLIGLLLFAWCLVAILSPNAVTVPIGRIWAPVAFFAIAALWAAVQIAPFTPADWHHPMWTEAAALLDVEAISRVSVNPFETGSALLKLLTNAGVFWLALQFGADRNTAKSVFYAVALTGVFYAVYGLFIEFSGQQTVLWVEKQAYRENLTSTFINRNSYATYAGIGLVCLTAIILKRFTKLAERDLTQKQKLRLFVHAITEREWWIILLWVVVGTALFLSDSRAGVASTCLGLLVFIASMGFARDVSRSVRRKLGAAMLLAFVALFLVSGSTLSTRIGQLTGPDTQLVRQAIYALSADAIDDAPILGSGYGTFPDIFHLYRTETSLLWSRADKAHNTYLENALELGIPAAAALVLAIAGIAFVCARGIRNRRRDAYFPATGLAVTVLVGVHSIPDFSLQIPAVALTYSLILGVACAQSWSSREPKKRPPPRRPAG